VLIDLVDHAFAETTLKQNTGNLVNVLVLQKQVLVHFELDKAEFVQNSQVVAQLLDLLLSYLFKVDHSGSLNWKLGVANREINWLIKVDSLFLAKHKVVETGINWLWLSWV